MPRERRAPGGAVPQPRSILSPAKRMPLNDDREEKAVRFQSRQALHDIQMNQIRAAASPAKRKSLAVAGSPRTPNGDDKENSDSQGLHVVGNAVTPMKRVPILANFEEWMKMATDNVRRDHRPAPTVMLIRAENQCGQFLELCAHRLFSRHVITKRGRWC